MIYALLEEFIHFLDGVGQGEDGHPVVGLDPRVAHGDEGVAAADDAADDGVAREVDVLQGRLRDPGARGDGVFQHLGVRPAHVADEADLVGEGELEDAPRRDEFLVDDRVHAHVLGEAQVLQVLHLGHGAGDAELLRDDAGEDVRLVVAGDGDEGVVFLDGLLDEEVGIAPVAADDVDVGRQVLRQVLGPVAVDLDELDVVDLAGELAGDHRADLSAAEDHDAGDIHIVLAEEAHQVCDALPLGHDVEMVHVLELGVEFRDHGLVAPGDGDDAELGLGGRRP